MPQPLRSLNQGRQLVPIAFIGLSLLAAVFVGQAILGKDFGKTTVFSAFGLVIFFSFFILVNWRLGVIAFFIWIVFEDLLRKFVGNDLLVYGVKDLIVLATLVGYWMNLRKHQVAAFKNPLRVPLLAWFGWALVEAFHPNLPHFLVPVVGLRMSFLYIPMLYLGHAFFENEKQFRNFLLLMLSMATLVAALGLVQSVVGLDFLNPREAPYLRLYLYRSAGAHAGIVPRPTATFVDAGRYAQYLFAMTYLGLGLLGYLYVLRHERHRMLRRWALLCWTAVVVALFLSGQRAAVVWMSLSAVVIVLARTAGRAHSLKAQRPLPLTRIILAGLLGLLLLGVALPERFEAGYRFYANTLDPESPYAEVASRPATHWRNIAYAFQSGTWLGHGTGTASLGLQYVYGMFLGRPYDRDIQPIEGGYASVLWEWGVLGLVLWLWWSLRLVRLVYEKVSLLKGSRFYWLGLSLGLYAFFILFPWFFLGMQFYQNYVAQAFLWFAVGILFRLPQLADIQKPVAQGAP